MSTETELSQSKSNSKKKMQPLKMKRGVSRWSIFSKKYGESFAVLPGEHQWRKYKPNINDSDSENDDESKENDDAISIDKSKELYAVVVVGTTGAGKSSVVSLFCKGAVVSNSTESCTKDVSIFPEMPSNNYIPKKNRSWVDTQGTDDSEMDDTDEKILKRIFKKLYKQKLKDVLIIWTVAGDMDRQKGEYLKQASFIQGFQSQHSRGNIWESTLIIQKMGQLQPKNSQIKGVIEAAKKKGADVVFADEETVDKHLVGFKCIDMFKYEDDDMYMTLKDANTSEDKLAKLGYVTKQKMKQIINDSLKPIKTFRIHFEDKICIKCSVRGDPRYLYYKCHSNPIPKHLKGLVPFHPEKLENFHPMDTQIVHPGSIKHFHEGELEKYHSKELEECEITDNDNPIYKHKGQFITIVGGNMCCKSTHFEWNCCGELEQNAKGCEKIFPKIKFLQYPCCKTKKDDKNNDKINGCGDRWKCCGRVGKIAKPCISVYSCCSSDPASVGCTTVWKCCEKDIDTKDPGCQKRYICCKMPAEARGCDDHWECCELPKTVKGCTTVCDRCDVIWGKKPGCLWKAQDEEQSDNAHDEDDFDEEAVQKMKKNYKNIKLNENDENEDDQKEFENE